MKNLNELKDPAVNTGRLSVQDFVQARKDEIRRLEHAIANASGKKRTFQTLPRTLRRRTASHNPKRVPRRLRDRAIREYLDDAPKPPPKRRKLEENEKVVPRDLAAKNKLAEKPVGAKYKNRQKTQVWLPTHIWHRKRAKLATRWEYVVPTTPTQKQYRMSHRLMNQSKMGTLLWDTSYYSTCLLTAPLGSLEAHFPGISKPLYNQRSWQGMALCGGTPLGPALVVRAKQGILINLHPSIYPQLFTELCKLGDAEDLRYAIGSVDLMGTRAMSTLASVLNLGKTPTLAKLGAIENLDILPYHGLLALSALDPRLTFPPSKKRIQGSTENVFAALEAFKSPLDSPLLGPERAASLAMPTQQEIEARKEPGKHIVPTPSDVRVPLVLAKLEDARIRVFMPWHWVLPFWLSLVSIPNTYIGGTAQFEQLAFEQSLHQFPKDYPTTSAGRQALNQAAENAEAAQLKKPRSKRRPPQDEAGSTMRSEFDRLTDPLLPITVHVAQRGTPRDNARIYSIPEGSLEAWKALEHKTCRMGELPLGTLLGFVTSGAYNLETGSGSGVGHATRNEGYCILRNPGQDTLLLATIKPVTTLYL